MEEDFVEFIDYNIVCRVCLNEGVVNINETTFKMDDMDVELSAAFEHFSTVKCNHDNLKTLLCESCVNGLLSSYEFVQSVNKSDQRFLEHQQLIAECNSSAAEQSGKDDSMINPDNIEVIFIKDQIEFDQEFQQKGTMDVHERMQTDFGLTELENLHQNTYMNEERIEENEHDRISKRKFTDDKSPESSFEVPENMTIVLPHYKVLDYTLDRKPSGDVDWSGKCIKTIDIIPVTVDVSHAHLPIPIPKAEDDVLMYACKYCPKAFASPYHLISHLKKLHICQFCLATFVKLNDLNAHLKGIHTKFDCTFCSKEFICNKNLRSHIKRAHSINLPAFVSLLMLKPDS